MLPINDLQRLDRSIDRDLRAAIEKCVARSWYLLGPETQAFEEEFAAYCGVGHCISLANGTDAIEIALRALEIQPGDEIITVANAGMYSTIAIRNIGAHPQYVDICSSDLNIDIRSLREKISTKTRAIIATHLYGQLNAIEAIIKIAAENGIPVIEDCAQAHGAERAGQKAGSFGAIGCFSFYPTKNLGAMGDAGAVITNDTGLAERIKKLRQYGWNKKYFSELSGGKNSRMDEIQAAVLRIKLKYLDNWNENRRQIAKKYWEALDGLELVLPKVYDNSYVGHLYVIRSRTRNALRTHLSQCQIATEIHYPIPDYSQESFLSFNSQELELPVTEQACQEVLTLPCFPLLKDEEQTAVITAVRSFWGQ